MRRFGSSLLVVLLLSVLAGSAAPQAQAPRAVDLLDRYRRGDFARIVADLTALPHQALPSIAVDLKTNAPGWIVGSTADVERRRLAAASVAREIATVGLETEWSTLRDLVEFGCRLVRENTAGPAEHAWFTASIALAQGGFDSGLLVSSRHIAHANGRFPKDRAFAFAQAVVIQSEIADGGAASYSVSTSANSDAPRLDPRRANRAASIQNLDNFGNDAGPIGAEANIRIGFLHFQNKDYPKALPFFAKARSLSDSRELLYLAHFLEGRTLQATNRIKEAGQAFERAWRILPGEGAGEAFSLLLFLSGQTTEAYAVANETLARAIPDPWRYLGYGEFVHLPALLADLRRFSSGPVK